MSSHHRAPIHDPHVQLKVEAVIRKVISNALRRGERGILDLHNAMKEFSSRIDGKTKPEDVKAKLATLGIILSPAEFTTLHSGFTDPVGYFITGAFAEYVSVGVLPESRQRAIEATWARIAGGKAHISLEALCDSYDPAAHPSVERGLKSAQQYAGEFLGAFRNVQHDGGVSKEDFASYAAGMSSLVEDDDAFAELLMRSFKRTGNSASVGMSSKSGAQHSSNTTSPAKKNYFASFMPPHDDEQGWQVPKRIVGYTGHVPLAAERFGETFHRIEVTTPSIVSDRTKPPAPEEVEPDVFLLRTGNKANAHNYRFS